jgi:hypothetical protein
MAYSKRSKQPPPRGPLVIPRREAGRLLGGVHPQTIGRWCREGLLERIVVGGRTMITVSSVESLVRRGKSEAAAKRKAQAAPAELTPA